MTILPNTISLRQKLLDAIEARENAEEQERLIRAAYKKALLIQLKEDDEERSFEEAIHEIKRDIARIDYYENPKGEGVL